MDANNSSNSPVAIDIFSGVGGLTLGLKRAGFRVAAAVEIEDSAYASYKTNHPEVLAIKQDLRTVRGRDLVEIAGRKIDLLAGCPPCQGFSSLTRRSSNNDPRNALVLEMARLISEIKPKAVMMENVPGLIDRGKVLFESLLNTLRDHEYDCTWRVLQVADYGIPQNRRRLVLFAGRRFKPILPKPTHNRQGTDGLLRWKTLRDVIFGMPIPVSLDQSKKDGGPQKHNWHVIRRLSATNIGRLEQTRPGESRAQLPKALRPDCHKENDKGYTNVYGRLSWDQLPVTITAGCTTLSMGRFGHPTELRTISVREAARIQTFPDTYVFDTPYIDRVCAMIGNALPCDFAEILAREIFRQLPRRRGVNR